MDTADNTVDLHTGDQPSLDFKALGATFKLLRIPFSWFLMPVFLLALSQAPQPDWLRAGLVFGVLHLLIYPASNGYNSYIDRDSGPIGGLKQPPPPPPLLYWVTLGMDGFGLLLGMLLGPWFALGLLGYVLASRAYSSDMIRLKKHPLLGFATIFCFQGAWTFGMVIAGVAPEALGQMLTEPRLLGLALASSCLVGGVYPLTQIYQHAADAARGDHSLSARLGYRGTFVFAAVLMAFGQVLLALSLAPWAFWLLQFCLLPVLGYFFVWARRVWHNTAAADFGHTMRLNLLAASCMNLCFGLMILIGRGA